MKPKATQQRFSDTFKAQAVKQVTERGHKASEVVSQLAAITLPMPGTSGTSAASPFTRARLKRSKAAVGAALPANR